MPFTHRSNIIFVLTIGFFWVASHNAEASCLLNDTEILLGRPTDTTITVNVVPDVYNSVSSRRLELYLELGIVSGVYDRNTSTSTSLDNQPIEFFINGLEPSTRYYYRLRYRDSAPGAEAYCSSPEHSFTTQRTPGETFTFTVTSDSHLGWMGLCNEDLYSRTLRNIAEDPAGPADFHFDLGDTFVVGSTVGNANPGDFDRVANVYHAQRKFFGIIGHSSPLFLVVGNHEDTEGWHLDDYLRFPGTGPGDSLPIMSTNARKTYYLNPVPGDFYSGDDDDSCPYCPYIEGDRLREEYYSFEWGDALFVVIEPYWNTRVRPYDTLRAPNENAGYETEFGDRWSWTLGREQFEWLEETLESSDAPFKFVFSHQVTGGGDGTMSSDADWVGYGRGGATVAYGFEWGGFGDDGTTWEFEERRPGWSMPVHQLMVRNGVSAFFHGHDHVYAREELDGIVYQECPQPGFSGGFSLKPGSYNGVVIDNAGHLRITVAAESVVVDYVRAFIGENEVRNKEVAHSYTISANPPNLPPKAFDGVVHVEEDQVVDFTLRAEDQDSDPLTFQIVRDPRLGTLQGKPPNLKYVPNKDANSALDGDDLLVFWASDGKSHGNIARVRFEIAPMPDAPLAVDQTVYMVEDQPKPFTLASADPDGDPLTYTVVEMPRHGVILGSGATRTYVPSADFFGNDRLRYTVSDGANDSGIAQVLFVVEPRNDAPAAHDSSHSVLEDDTLIGDLAAEDIDTPLESLTYSLYGPPAHGQVTFDAGGFTYVPDPDYWGADGFSFYVGDGQAESNIATVTIWVEGVNDPPQALNTAVTTEANTAVHVQLYAWDTGEDGGALTFSVVDGPSHGSLLGRGASLQYSPAWDFVGEDSFTFEVSDGYDRSNLATVSITVTPGGRPNDTESEPQGSSDTDGHATDIDVNTAADSDSRSDKTSDSASDSSSDDIDSDHRQAPGGHEIHAELKTETRAHCHSAQVGRGFPGLLLNMLRWTLF